MIEQWKPYPFNNNYEVSDFGRVRNKKGLVLKQQVNPDGYYKLNLNRNSKKTTEKVHRMVMYTFCWSDEAKYLTVDHLDCDKLNNRLDNLEWVTMRDNVTRKMVRKALEKNQMDRPVHKYKET